MRALLWFKQDLRLDDHPALQAALNASRLLPLYVIDPALLQLDEFGSRRIGVHRARFLLESLAALDGALRQRGSKLLVLTGHPEEVIAQLVGQFDLRQVLTLDEIAPQEIAQIARVRESLGSVPLRTFNADSLFAPGELPCPLEQIPQVYSKFRSLVDARQYVFQPAAAPEQLPPLPEGAEGLSHGVPTPSQFGLGEALQVSGSAFPFSGGEAAAQARLRDYLWDSQSARRYKETRNDLIGSEYSSKFSPWLANGCLSPRRAAAELRRHEALYGANESTNWLWLSLLWREFFRCLLLRHGQNLFMPGGLKATERAPQQIDERFQQWAQGRTGMPLVDANMRELAATGFMSNRGRQVVASYLVSDLQQDWRHGAAWFEEHLIDYDPASNWGNWAYLAAVGADPRLKHMFNALKEARRYDPLGEYVSLWIPELRNLPPHLRHTPFLLSPAELEPLHYPKLEQIPEAWQEDLNQVA